jgi:FKBP-type peptidyl-prolyl cis-trans isomerase 2
VIEEGEGEPATSNDLIAMRYVLSKEDGTVLQRSADTGQPFMAMTDMVFPGFAEGLQLMREGGRYKLWVPPRLAYGNQVPPGAPFTAQDTLVFEIEVFQIGRGFAAMARQMMGPQAPPPQPQGAEGRNPAQGAATPPPAGGGGNNQR